MTLSIVFLREIPEQAFDPEAHVCEVYGDQTEGLLFRRQDRCQAVFEGQSGMGTSRNTTVGIPALLGIASFLVPSDVWAAAVSGTCLSGPSWAM